ncbi:hypothetical protein QBC44DRAFT_309628 [Cladorrhinum sp. PSN332]|nr:hypothetical protein QBC44DRAFT_309628 [Cladorrhinum sp. PSN332]
MAANEFVESSSINTTASVRRGRSVAHHLLGPTFTHTPMPGPKYSPATTSNRANNKSTSGLKGISACPGANVWRWSSRPRTRLSLFVETKRRSPVLCGWPNSHATSCIPISEDLLAANRSQFAPARGSAFGRCPATFSAAAGMQGMHQPTLTMGYRPMMPPMYQAWADSAPVIAAPTAQHSAAILVESAETKTAFDDLFGQYDALISRSMPSLEIYINFEALNQVGTRAHCLYSGRSADELLIYESEFAFSCR